MIPLKITKIKCQVSSNPDICLQYMIRKERGKPRVKRTPAVLNAVAKSIRRILNVSENQVK